MEMASVIVANISQGMADQMTLSASGGSESESESNHANSSVNSSSHVEIENGNTGGKKPTSWNESRIKLPSSYFQFMYDKKDGKGFLVKCLICHKTKTKFNKKFEIKLLTITNNSGYNAKRHKRWTSSNKILKSGKRAFASGSRSFFQMVSGEREPLV
ncbi:hypothetical protein OUZ56_024103 [Daphnia magna]|uniref:BED-type domain-containing protein n=1 Tax=Daphnia magna TaxID=35525 RepID=A0ABR0B0G8_9CRUS|nr:hypothetical protein OUZ56_024103 [Daphnia magna]